MTDPHKRDIQNEATRSGASLHALRRDPSAQETLENVVDDALIMEHEAMREASVNPNSEYLASIKGAVDNCTSALNSLWTGVQSTRVHDDKWLNSHTANAKGFHRDLSSLRDVIRPPVLQPGSTTTHQSSKQLSIPQKPEARGDRWSQGKSGAEMSNDCYS
jgi:hypothetical protein